MQETAIGGTAREFPGTRWTLILSAQQKPEARRAAMDELLSTYWKPLYFYARRKGMTIEASKDAVQGFCAHLLERDFLARLDPGKGRFRAYLRTSLDHFLANLHEHASAQKRGGGARVASLDFDPAERDLGESPDEADAAFDREWALGVMERALRRLQADMNSSSFDAVAKFFHPGTPPSYEEAAAASGMGPAPFKALLHRARVRFRDFVRDEVADTVSDEGEADAEIAELIRILAA